MNHLGGGKKRDSIWDHISNFPSTPTKGLPTQPGKPTVQLPWQCRQAGRQAMQAGRQAGNAGRQNRSASQPEQPTSPYEITLPVHVDNASQAKDIVSFSLSLSLSPLFPLSPLSPLSALFLST
eukprot:TRINITY_DN21_c0_g1_i4.p1 TRINITY_DN21_c0_g1~~TRINITY_DN21_c0_g1_i4.p1  ORF type:complete len:123 (-),score=14.11 TRINITY_DN21_c0_g1_i4:98-466(-)